MRTRAAAETVRFDGRLEAVGKSVLVRLPEGASRRLPSRGQVAVRGSINGVDFETVVEPDGDFGHWIRIEEMLQRRAGIRAGDAATVDIEPVKDWPEPAVPSDLEAALAAAPHRIKDLWREITPMARWEWVRWVAATNNPDTRRRRVEVSISKMKSGKRRPCCFNLAACTDPTVSRNGKLLDAAD